MSISPINLNNFNNVKFEPRKIIHTAAYGYSTHEEENDIIKAGKNSYNNYTLQNPNGLKGIDRDEAIYRNINALTKNPVALVQFIYNGFKF